MPLLQRMLMTISPTASVRPQAYLGDGGAFDRAASIVGVRIAADVTVPASVTIEDDVKIGVGVVFEEGSGHARIGRGARIGGNATLGSGIDIGANAVVRAGAVVTRPVPPNAIVSGNPAAIEGYVDAPVLAAVVDRSEPCAAVASSAVAGVTIHRLSVVSDMRGSLSVGEVARDLPFAPLRYFLVYDVPSEEVRGEHAHHECHQFLICVRGSVAVVADDGQSRQEILLDRLDKGVYLPPMIWGTQYRYSADALLLVFASHAYNPADYIRRYADFIALRRDRGVG